MNGTQTASLAPRKSTSPCLPSAEVLVSVTEDIDMSKPSDLVQGTLDMLLLKILALEPMNGFAVSQRLKQMSGDVLQVSDGSLYPALQQVGTRGLDHGGVENVRVWPAGGILFAHTAGAATARKRSRQLGQAFECHFAGY